MRITYALTVLGLVALISIPWSSGDKAEAAFECPVVHMKMTPTALKETAAQRAAATQMLAGPELENAILLIADDLRKKNPAVDTSEIVNYLLTAYCPLLAKESGLSDSEKRARIDRFSSQVYQLIRN